MYAAKRFSCGPGAEKRDPTKQFYIKMSFCDPVVVASCMKSVQDLEALDAVEDLPAPDQSVHFLNRFQHEAPAAFEQLIASPVTLHYFLTLASYSTFL